MHLWDSKLPLRTIWQSSEDFVTTVMTNWVMQPHYAYFKAVFSQLWHWTEMLWLVLEWRRSRFVCRLFSEIRFCFPLTWGWFTKAFLHSPLHRRHFPKLSSCQLVIDHRQPPGSAEEHTRWMPASMCHRVTQENCSNKRITGDFKLNKACLTVLVQ